MALSKKISAIDLFCGAGGLTHGLESSGISVELGIDIDPSCAHPYNTNNHATFLEADITSLSSNSLKAKFQKNSYTLLAGCAPCQPFSTYSRSAKQKHGNNALGTSEDWRLVEYFGDFIKEIQPDLVTMENVPPLALKPVFNTFLSKLEGYWKDWRIIECQSIGLPQTRKRLVLIASKLAPISIPYYNLSPKDVKSTIAELPKINAGEQDPLDRLHKSSRLSKLNLNRIRHSTPGGTWRDWPKNLRTDCHLKKTGETYPSVYGRMQWNEPAPTITTQCFGYGNGRFGHPEQDRAISLREAAMLQGFPREYSFAPESEPISFSKIGRLIGNAVPVTLGAIIGSCLQEHVKNHEDQLRDKSPTKTRRLHTSI